MSWIWLLLVPPVAKSSGISIKLFLHNTLGTGTTAVAAVLNHWRSPLPKNRASNTAALPNTLDSRFPPQFNGGGPEEALGQSECLHQHREEQREVLGAPDGEFVCGVEVDDLWDGVKRRAVLSQDVFAVL